MKIGFFFYIFKWKLFYFFFLKMQKKNTKIIKEMQMHFFSILQNASKNHNQLYHLSIQSNQISSFEDFSTEFFSFTFVIKILHFYLNYFINFVSRFCEGTDYVLKNHQEFFVILHKKHKQKLNKKLSKQTSQDFLYIFINILRSHFLFSFTFSTLTFMASRKVSCLQSFNISREKMKINR